MINIEEVINEINKLYDSLECGLTWWKDPYGNEYHTDTGYVDEFMGDFLPVLSKYLREKFQ